MSSIEINPRGSGPMAGRQRATATNDLASAEASGASGVEVDSRVLSSEVPSIPHLDAAREWAPGRDGITGAQANVQITAAYAQLDKAMSHYLGNTPTIANWTTFGKYASADAGQQIARLEAMQRLLHGQASAVAPLMRCAWGGNGWHLLKGASSLFQSTKQMLGLCHQVKTLANLKSNVTLLRNSLVFGNTGIIQDIGPAYALFLTTEAQGKNGVDALRAKGYGRPPLDPQGYILNAFEDYSQAKALGEQADALRAEHPRNRMRDQQDAIVALANRRRSLIDHANGLLAFEEQWYTIQKPEVFGGERIRALMGRLSSMLVMHDAVGTHRLLRTGGNWGDFITRMGVKEVSASDPLAKSEYAIRFTSPDGVTHTYVQRYALNGMRYADSVTDNDAILPYMASFNDDQMVLGSPAPLPSFLLTH